MSSVFTFSFFFFFNVVRSFQLCFQPNAEDVYLCCMAQKGTASSENVRSPRCSRLTFGTGLGEQEGEEKDVEKNLGRIRTFVLLSSSPLLLLQPSPG